MEFLKWNRKILIVLMIAFVALSGCYSDEDEDDDDPSKSKDDVASSDTGTEDTDTNTVTSAIYTTTISGVVATGEAANDASVSLRLSDDIGSVDCENTNEDGEYTCTISASSTATDTSTLFDSTYPVVVEAVLADSKEEILGFVASSSEEGNANPITSKVLSDLELSGDLDSLTGTEFNDAGNAFTKALLGDGIDFSVFTKSFTARSENSTNDVSLGDMLLDLLIAVEADFSNIEVSLSGADTSNATTTNLLSGAEAQLQLAGIVAAVGNVDEVFSDTGVLAQSNVFKDVVSNIKTIASDFKTAAADLDSSFSSIAEKVQFLSAHAQIVASVVSTQGLDLTVAGDISTVTNVVANTKTAVTDKVDSIKSLNLDQIAAFVEGLATVINDNVSEFIKSVNDFEKPTGFDDALDTAVNDAKAAKHFALSQNIVTINNSTADTASVDGTGSVSEVISFSMDELKTDSPTMTLQLVSDARATEYKAVLGLSIKGNGSDTRMIKSVLDKVVLEVQQSGVAKATVGRGAKSTIAAYNADGSSEFTAVIRNVEVNGPISTDTEGNLIFDPNFLRTRILNQLSDYNLEDKVLPGTYDFTIYVYIDTEEATLATVDGSDFTAFADTTKKSEPWLVGDAAVPAGAFKITGSFTVTE